MGTGRFACASVSCSVEEVLNNDLVEKLMCARISEDTAPQAAEWAEHPC